MLQLTIRRAALVLALLLPLMSAQADVASDNGRAILAAASPLGDRALGKADAPVVLIEYASATCPHCAEFHQLLLPQIKSEYIDTGKVRFIFREFPLDDNALAVFMLIRCLPEEKFFATTDLIFRRQQIWLKAQNPGTEITKIMALAGMDQKQFEGCLANRSMARIMLDYAKTSAKDFGIKGTPALFVNGQFIDGHEDLADVKKALDAAIAAASGK